MIDLKRILSPRRRPSVRVNRHGPTHPGRLEVRRMAARGSRSPRLQREILKIATSDRWPGAKIDLIRAEIEREAADQVHDEVMRRPRR